jgi:hypothetical protein
MNRLFTTSSAVSGVLVLIACTQAGAQWLKHPTPGIPRTADGKPNLTAPTPRTPDRKPDLSGIWRTDPGGYSLDITSDLRRDEALPWADALFRQRSEEFSKDHPGFRCMPEIGPFYTFGIFKILQTPGTLALLSEQGVYRQILTDGRRLPEDPNPTWIGYSVGRWDGDTLIVESAGFNDRTWLDFGGHPHTEALHVTERYRRKDFGHMQIQITLDDSKAYARPWTISLDAQLVPDTELLESVCNENEKSIQHFVVTEEDRRKARTTATVSLDVLRKYVGAYELTDQHGRKASFTVTLNGDQLTAHPPTGGGYPLVAESETVFSIAGARVEFFENAEGAVTHFVVSTVEGDQKAVRRP